MSVSTILERQMFKAVAGGYVFQPPPPTSFHNTSAYLVSESQKADITAIYRTDSAKRVRLVTATAVGAGGRGGLVAPSRGSARRLCRLCVCDGLDCRTGAWFLPYLEPESARIAARSREPSSLRRATFFPFRGRMALFGAPSPFFIALYSAVFGFWLGTRYPQHPPFTDATSTLAFFSLALNMFWATKAQQKWRSAAQELRHRDSSP